MSTDEIITTDLKYAQWNPFFTSLQKDIDQIKEFDKRVRKDTKLIEDFYSLINTIFNSHIAYAPEMQKKLDKIELKIYSPKYQKDLIENSSSVQIRVFQFKIIKELEQCFQILINKFEENGLIPKKVKTKTNKIGAVRTMH